MVVEATDIENVVFLTCEHNFIENEIIITDYFVFFLNRN